MKFDLIPGNQEISEILAAQVTGMYRYVNDAMSPYVTITPADGASISVYANHRLRLNRNALQKLTDRPITFVVMYDEAMELFLAELASPGARTLKKSPAKPPMRLGKLEAEMQPEGGVQVPARSHKRITLISDAAPSMPTEVAVSEALQAIVTREDVHPELGDYLVMPTAMALVQDSEPSWVVRSPHVAQIHVVKPRLRIDHVVEAC